MVNTEISTNTKIKNRFIIYFNIYFDLDIYTFNLPYYYLITLNVLIQFSPVICTIYMFGFNEEPKANEL